jgi:hypothetical protein
LLSSHHSIIATHKDPLWSKNSAEAKNAQILARRDASMLRPQPTSSPQNPFSSCLENESMIRPSASINWIMSIVLLPWQLFFLILSGWVNRRQQEMIEFQNAQIQA